jgi:SAM-dependent methyltransferase
MRVSVTFHPCYLSTWLKKEPGALLVEMERAQLQKLLKPLTANFLIQIGGLPELATASTARFKWFFNTQPKSGSIQVALDELPLAPQSVDVIIMVHVLEFVPKPRAVLREAYQALAPGGQLIIVNLNPWSMWGLKHWLTQEDELPWNGHFWTLSRVKHWLRDLGLRIVMSDTFCFRPPLHSLRSWEKLLWLEALGPWFFPTLGGFYILAAQKRVEGMTPIMMRAWSKKMALNKSYEPTTRTLMHENDTDY